MIFSKSDRKKRISWVIIFSLIFSFILPMTTFATGDKENLKDIEVTKVLKIIKDINNINVEYGTTKENAIEKLPKTTTIIDTLDNSYDVDLNWNIENFSEKTAGEYVAKANFELPKEVQQTEPETKLELETNVLVKEKVEIKTDEKNNKTISIDEAINKTVSFYKNNNPGNPEWEWEAYIGLWGVGKTIKKDYEWESIDPGIKADSSDNDTITYAYGLLGQGKDPSNIWGGRNLFKELSNQQRENGVFTNIGKHIFAMLLLDAGEKMDADVGEWNEVNKQRAIDGLLEMQNPDGSFGTFSFLDHTGWSLIALSEYKEQPKVNEAIDKALSFLKIKQTDNGGFDYNDGWEKGENSNSISVIVQGLISVGEDVTNSNGKWSENGNTPIDALLAYQQDDGSFLWKHGMSITGPSTKQALVTLADVKHKRSTWLRLGDEIELESVTKEKLEKSVEELISSIEILPNISEINLNNKSQIMKAYSMYLSLPEEYQLKVTNNDLLLQAKETIEKIEKEIKSINDGIWSLPGKPSEITLSHKEKVLDLIKRYNLLSDSDKKHIEYYSEVIAAKEQIDKLQKENQNNEDEDKVKIQIPNSNVDYKIPLKVEDKEVTINIPERKQSKVLIDLPKGEKLPKIVATKGNILALIPEGTKIVSGNGKNIELISSMDINDHKLKEKVSKILSKGEYLKEISQVFSMGTDERIEFSEYVTLIFTGMKGKEAAYIEDGKLHKIQKFQSNEEGLNSGKLEYAYENGNDLIVKTKHFTDFIAYETKDKNIKAENEINEENENNDNYSSPKTSDEGILIPIILFLISSFTIVFLFKKRKIN